MCADNRKCVVTELETDFETLLFLSSKRREDDLTKIVSKAQLKYMLHDKAPTKQNQYA